MYNLMKKIAKIFITKKREDNVILYELFGSIPLRKVVFDNLYVKKFFLGIKYRTIININKLQESNQNLLEKADVINQNILDKINEINQNLIAKTNETSQNLYNHLYSNEFKTRLVQIACHANAVTATHQKTFGKYKNFHQDQDIVLVATGPSLNKYVPIESAVHVGVNRAFTCEKVELDYLFAQDFRAINDCIGEFCNYSKTRNIFLGCAEYHESYLDCIIPHDISNYYGIHRYYVGHSVSPLCPYTLDVTSNQLINGGSVVFPAMQFILYTNPKRIYLVGCDCSTGYFDDKENKQSATHMVDGWQKLKEFAKIYYPETEIISINPVGLAGMFKDVYSNHINNKTLYAGTPNMEYCVEFMDSENNINSF